MHWWTTQNCGLRRACYKTIIGKNLLLHYWCSGRPQLLPSVTYYIFIFWGLRLILQAFLQYYEYILLKQGLTYINVHCNVHGLPKTFCVIYCHFKNEIDFLTKMQFLSKVVFLLTKKSYIKFSLKCYLIWTSYWKFEFSAIDEKLSTSFSKNISSVNKNPHCSVRVCTQITYFRGTGHAKFFWKILLYLLLAIYSLLY